MEIELTSPPAAEITSNGYQQQDDQRKMETKQLQQAIARKPSVTDTACYLPGDEHLLEKFDTILEEFEKLAQILNIKDYVIVAKYRKRMEKLTSTDSSMSTKLNEINSQLRACRRLLIKGKENYSVVTSCNAEQSYHTGDSKVNIGECISSIKQFNETVKSWLSSVELRSSNLQEE